MTTTSARTWGAAGQVGEWSGRITIPDAQRTPPLDAARFVLSRVVPALQAMHRPRELELSWGDFDDGGNELAFHELERSSVAGWPDVAAELARATGAARGTAALSALFLELDTAVVELDGSMTWSDTSARLQISIEPPEVAPVVARVAYASYIDVWLSTTYGAGYQPRSNRAAAAANRPRLAAALHQLGACLDARVVAESSQLYPLALTDDGFRDVDELPPRTG
jgi:hypothetical protein